LIPACEGSSPSSPATLFQHIKHRNGHPRVAFFDGDLLDPSFRQLGTPCKFSPRIS
jgi:hypothetical protein